MNSIIHNRHSASLIPPILAGAALLVSSILYADVKPGADFLRMDTGSRPSAMAGAFTAAADDINSLWWNPAGLALIQDNEIMFMHNEAGESIRNEYIAFARPYNKLRGSIGMSISYLSIGDIQGYDAGGVATEDLSAYDIAAALTWAGRISGPAYAGASAKFIQQKLDSDSAATYALDAGVLYIPGPDGLRLGASARNMGGQLEFIDEGTPLPFEARAGAAYLVDIFGSRLLVAADAVLPREYDNYFCAGAECTIYDLLTLRAGFRSEDDLSSGMRLGGGIKTSALMFDYAWMPRGDFQDSHRISATLKFGQRHTETSIEKNIRIHYEAGKKYFQNGDLLKAYREFKDIMLVAPRHEQAKNYISRIELRIEDVEVSKYVSAALDDAKKDLDSGDLTSARARLDDILALKPDHPMALEYLQIIDSRFKEVVDSVITRGIEFYNKAEYDPAESELVKALSLDPENEKAIEYLEMVKQKQEDLKKIRMELERKQQERLRQRKIAALTKKVRSTVSKKDWDSAINTSKRLLELDPENALALTSMKEALGSKADSLYKDKKLLESMELYKKAADLDPDDKDIKEKIIALEKELAVSAKDLNKKALIEYSRGNLKKAIKLWEKAVSYDSSLTTASENLARAKKELTR